MKVYFVYVEYTNGYPDWYQEYYGFEDILKIFTSKEKALAYINGIKPEDMSVYMEILEGWEEAKDPCEITIREFRRNVYPDTYEWFSY